MAGCKSQTHTQCGTRRRGNLKSSRTKKEGDMRKVGNFKATYFLMIAGTEIT